LEDALLLQLSQLNVAGIIFITERTSESPIFRSISVPLVIIGLNYESDIHDVVSIEERRGIRSIVEHLVEQGHRRVAFIGNRDVLPRLEYLREYMTAAGLPLPPEYVVMNDLDGEISGYAAAQTLLSLPVLPTAVVAGFDAMALTAYRAFTEHGLRIPEDISLVGFDNAWFCRYLPISLTSVDYDVTAECRVAIAILLDRIQQNSSQAVQAVTIVPKLIVRESSTLRK